MLPYLLNGSKHIEEVFHEASVECLVGGVFMQASSRLYWFGCSIIKRAHQQRHLWGVIYLKNISIYHSSETAFNTRCKELCVRKLTITLATCRQYLSLTKVLDNIKIWNGEHTWNRKNILFSAHRNSRKYSKS